MNFVFIGQLVVFGFLSLMIALISAVVQSICGLALGAAVSGRTRIRRTLYQSMLLANGGMLYVAIVAVRERIFTP